ILHLAVDLDRERGFGEAGTDGRRDVGAAHRLVEFPDRSVRQGNTDHGNHLEMYPNTAHRPARGAGGQRPGSGTSVRARPNQVRTVVSFAGAGINIRSMGWEIVVPMARVKLGSCCLNAWRTSGREASCQKADRSR